MNLFKKRKYVPINIIKENKLNDPIIPDGMWLKCSKCGRIIYKKELGKFKICPNCRGYFRLKAMERIETILDDDCEFIEFDSNMFSKNPMLYPGYEEKLLKIIKDTELKEAVITGEGFITKFKTVICVMDSSFIMGSMGSVVGEKITRAVEYATENKLPIIIFTASGGARMQEGIISLMQMAKVSAAIARHSEKGLLYITVLTDPTTGGVTASFAMQGDIILAEPKALIGFAGRRVIEQTINENLPEDFQTAEFLLEHGFIDKIVNREEMQMTLSKILKIHNKV